MAELAVADEPRFAVSDCDVVREGATYTFDTVQIFPPAFSRRAIVVADGHGQPDAAAQNGKNGKRWCATPTLPWPPAKAKTLPKRRANCTAGWAKRCNRAALAFKCADVQRELHRIRRRARLANRWPAWSIAALSAISSKTNLYR